ncbi:MAG: DNA topoisomerase 1 [bacterium ADurb.Bin400]|nr:MAG: DNA topoisomerase 1 [bacterium ADurb.Bin400]
MKDALFEVMQARVEARAKDQFVFLATGERMVFDGFIKLYTEGRDDETDLQQGTLPELNVGEKLRFWELIKEQKFTEPPKRYTEATLVKKMESLGIGRPSTYAPTISTIIDRGYVELQEKRFQPTEIGEIVTDLLVKHFAGIVDYQFTARMEDDLDSIAGGDKKWVPVVEEFYRPFEKELAVKMKEIDKKDFIKEEVTAEVCPECGKPIVIRLGKFGKFMACSGFSKCKYSKPLVAKEETESQVVVHEGEVKGLEEEHEACSKCGGQMVMKEGRFGRFLACENYPKCKSTKSISTTTGMKCPDCQEGEVVERRTKRGKIFWGCSRYPKCKYASWDNPAQNKEKTAPE